MPHRIEVATKSELPDPMGDSIRRQIGSLGFPVEDVRVTNVYTIDGDLPQNELSSLAHELFADPVTQFSNIDEPVEGIPYDWSIEVGYLPGVTDNVGRSSRDAILDLGIELEPDQGVYASRRYLISGELTKEQLDLIARDVLANGIVERWGINKGGLFQRDNYLSVPRVELVHEPTIRTIDLGTDEELLRTNSNIKEENDS